MHATHMSVVIQPIQGSNVQTFTVKLLSSILEAKIPEDLLMRSNRNRRVGTQDDTTRRLGPELCTQLTVNHLYYPLFVERIEAAETKVYLGDSGWTRRD
jgi:hypothetical protein